MIKVFYGYYIPHDQTDNALSIDQQPYLDNLHMYNGEIFFGAILKEYDEKGTIFFQVDNIYSTCEITEPIVKGYDKYFVDEKHPFKRPSKFIIFT